jgi:hypothetical protein
MSDCPRCLLNLSWCECGEDPEILRAQMFELRAQLHALEAGPVPKGSRLYRAEAELEKARARVSQVERLYLAAESTIRRFEAEVTKEYLSEARTTFIAWLDEQFGTEQMSHAEKRERIQGVLDASLEVRKERDRLKERIRLIAESGCSANLLAWSRADLIQGLSCTPADRCSACRCHDLISQDPTERLRPPRMHP